jgi:transcriptional regulator with XRE-family HTH domain
MNQILQTLTDRRKKLGITQTDMARESGVSLSMIAKLESGHRNNPTLRIIQLIEATLDRLEGAKAARGNVSAGGAGDLSAEANAPAAAARSAA